MKTVSPIGSTAIILLVLAMVVRMKGCTMERGALYGAKFGALDPKAASALGTVDVGIPWYNASIIFLGLGLICGLIWFRNRMVRRRLPASTRPPRVIKAPPRRRRKRR